MSRNWFGLALLSDPQTSGGLPVSSDSPAVAEMLGLFQRRDFLDVAIIDDIVAGTSSITVNP
jgi:selenide,water dikinase